MCGIFGYVGVRSAEPILLEGLRTLEYRGYDSAGIFIPGHGSVKAVGPIATLADKITEPIAGHSGIAHTRWATHGTPTEANAHPHHDLSEDIWVVHNGIIDNWREIKEGLLQQGITFHSETDSEVLAKLIGTNYRGDLRQAIRDTLPMIQGTYGIAVMHKDKPDELHAARWGSPIVIGIGEDSHFLASDPSALLAHTKDVVYLDDGDVALLTPQGYDIISMHNGNPTQKMQERIEWDLELIQKNGYEHFMLKEIFEAPEVIENTIRGRLISDKGRAKLGGLESVLPQLRELDRLDITGCGSAYYAGLTGSYMLEEYADIATSVSLASEYRHRSFHHSDHGALLSVSQSGETADTLAAIQKAREQNQLTLGVVNVVGSSIARATHAGVYNHAGPEIAVASTKAFISQLTVFALLTLLIGRERSLSLETGKQLATDLQALPAAIASMLESTTHIQEIATWLAQFDHALYIGRHAHAPIAYEGALKLKEVTYMHAEGYPGGELKHGPIALLDERCPVIALAPTDHVHDKMIANMEEAKARSAPVLAVTTDDDTACQHIADYVIKVPKVHPVLQPIVSTIPLHLLAYHVGIAKGYNVDRPRNLAKSVTVE